MSTDLQPGRVAVVLLSGGLDSAVCVAAAAKEGFRVHALSIDYGQRHKHELRAAAGVARQLGVSRHLVIPMDLRGVGGSALTSDTPVPKGRGADAMAKEIPVTYVPARNLTFLSLAVGYAEVCSARDVYIGVNAVDYSGYPDCRPEFIASFEQTTRLATKAGVQGAGVKIRTPLQGMSKAEIVRLGVSLGVDFSLTTSCYDPTDAGLSCGQCDACSLRRRGFQDAGVPDPTRYAGTLHAAPAGAPGGRQGNVQAWG